jgi:hypothetical protein
MGLVSSKPPGVVGEKTTCVSSVAEANPPETMVEGDGESASE